MVGEDQVPGYPGPSGLIVERTDTLRRFVFEGYPFRGQLVHVDTAGRR